MFRLNSKIDIGTYTFTSVVEVEINSSYATFTDTAIIKLPTYIRNNNLDLTTVFKKGDAVNIYLGYYPELPLRFTGVVSEILPENPLILKCEDFMWKLKQVTITNYTLKNATLKQLLTDILPSDIEFNNLDINLGTIRINSATVVEVLKNLKKNYGLYSFFRNNVLWVGTKEEIDRTSITKNFNFYGQDGNIKPDHNLIYKKTDAQSFVLRGKLRLDDNSELVKYAYYKNEEVIVSSGKQEGETRDLNFYGITEAEMDDILAEKLTNYVWTGYEGSFNTFLQPYMQHGDVPNLGDLRFPEKDGLYKAKSVITRFGINGGEQGIELDNKI